jgi:hypothetical protein
MDKKRNRRVDKLKTLIIAILMMAATAAPAMAQQVHFSASLDTGNIIIGDQLEYRLQLIIPEGFQFEWPQINDSLTGHVEILRKSKVDTLRLSDGMLDVRQAFTITSFDTGFYVIPPYEVRFRENDQTPEISTLETEPYLLNVFSIPVDLSQPIKPIKDPIAVPITFIEVLPWILLAIAIGGLLTFFLTRKKKTSPVLLFKPKPKRAAHLIALEELEQLKMEKLWQQGLIKDYYSRLSGVVRAYIENCFDIPAVESTTFETLHFLRKKPIAKQTLDILQELLELSDLVKFAKAKPLPSEHDQSMNLAEVFVKNTIPDGTSEATFKKADDINQLDNKTVTPDQNKVINQQN